MSSPELGFEFSEEKLGPMVYLDIARHGSRDTILLAYTPRDYSVGCVLLEDDRAIVAGYDQPTTGGDYREGLSVVGGFSWEEGLSMSRVLVQEWVDKVQMRTSPFDKPLAIKHDQNLPEPKAFTHTNGDRLPDIDNAISQMKMKRLRDSGFYVPIGEIVELAK